MPARSVFAAVILCTACFAYADSSDIDVSLITIGPGSPVYLWWGHSALLIHDKTTNREFFVNFGLFHFTGPGFYKDFIMGRLYFMVGASSSKWEIENYRAADRHIVRQHLNLSNNQKETLVSLVNENLLPENRVYRYEHYSDNCATRPRDILDSALGGVLKDISGLPTGLSIRDHTRRFTSRNPFIEWWLMYAQGGVIDGEADIWKSMFLPSELYRTVKSIPGLVSHEEIIHEKTMVIPDKPANTGYFLFPLLAGVLLALCSRNISARRQHFQKTAVALENTLLAIIGLMGSFLLFMVFFTEHSVVRMNFNLLVTPCFALLPVFFRRAAGARLRSILWYILFVISFLMLLLQPLLPHRNLNIILFFFPLYCVFGGIPLLRKLLNSTFLHSILSGK